MNNKNNFSTDNLHLSGFLLTKNYELIEAKKTGRSKFHFIFESSDDLLRDVNIFLMTGHDNKQVYCDPRLFIENIRRLKTLLSSI